MFEISDKSFVIPIKMFVISNKMFAISTQMFIFSKIVLRFIWKLVLPSCPVCWAVEETSGNGCLEMGFRDGWCRGTN